MERFNYILKLLFSDKNVLRLGVKMTEVYKLKPKKVYRLPDNYNPRVGDGSIEKGEKYRLELFGEGAKKFRIGENVTSPAGSVIYVINKKGTGRINSYGIDLVNESGQPVHASHVWTQYYADWFHTPEGPKEKLLHGEKFEDGIHAPIGANDVVSLWREYMILMNCGRLKMHDVLDFNDGVWFSRQAEFEDPLLGFLYVMREVDNPYFRNLVKMNPIAIFFKDPDDHYHGRGGRGFFLRNKIPFWLLDELPKSFPTGIDDTIIPAEGKAEIIFSLDDVVNA